MGQYWKCMVELPNGKCTGLVTYDYDNGAKLMEHSYVGNAYVDACIRMIRTVNFVYGPCRVAWVGDYADSVIDELPEAKQATAKEMYEAGWKDDDFTPAFSLDLIPLLKYELQKHSVCGYLIDIDRKECIHVVDEKREEYPWQIHPLPLLTAISNGQGGGDYHGKDNVMVGRWACDHILWVPDSDDGGELSRVIKEYGPFADPEVDFQEES